MAKDAEGIGSGRAELKKLLRLAHDTPVHMAFALGEDGKAILKLDKMKPPRSLEKGLKDGAKGARNHRFGTVAIDPANPKVVKFVVNKEVGGIARKLVLALKGTGFSKVQLVTEDGATLEDAEAEDTEAEDAEAGDAGDNGAGTDIRPSFALVDDGESVTSRRDVQADAPSIEPTPAAAAPDPATPDAGALTRMLSGLVKQMLGVIAQDPTQKTALAELATDAQASLKRGDLAQAAAGIEILRLAIAGAAEGDAPASGGDSLGADGPGTASPGADVAGGDSRAGQAIVQTLRKSRVAWTATRAKIDAELGKLSSAIVQASDGEDGGDDLENQFYAAVEPVLSTLDDSLSDILSQAADAGDDERQLLMAQARDTIGRYASFVEGNDVISRLDSNPFVPLAIAKTLAGTLSTLASIMR